MNSFKNAFNNKLAILFEPLYRNINLCYSYINISIDTKNSQKITTS